MRLVVQAEQETLRVYERQSRRVDRGRCALSACCCLLDTAAAAAQLMSPEDDRLPSANQSSPDCEQMMRDVSEKFGRLRVSFRSSEYGQT